jgi:Cdc6-like AAA superfamily ATPase/DNA-binding MarR family transcriptional regulator
MQKPLLTSAQLNAFHEAAQSLKLYRRAELQDEDSGNNLIEKLYVDPLPNNHVLQTTIKPNTTFIIGRKGTGKSTVFQRAQHELRKNSSFLSVYIDIKTLYESSTVDSNLLSKAQEIAPNILPEETLHKLLLYKAFLKEVVLDIQNELKKRVKSSIWENLKLNLFGPLTLDELFKDLDDLINDDNDDRFMSILGLKKVKLQESLEKEQSKGLEGNLTGKVSSNPEISAGLTISNTTTVKQGNEQNYSDILMRVLDIKELLLKLKKLLETINIKRLYIFIDDFSELPEDAMKIVVDTLLAPLNNWSEELIKFKIAAYPGRVYYGEIDKTKIDEISLDTYKMYGGNDVSTMEDKAVDFTRRIIERRINHYCGKKPEIFFTQNQNDDLWRLLFYATMANPRNLGYILFYLYESQLIYGRTIGSRSIRDAAQKYYEDKIEPYFSMNKFLHQTFDERSSVYSLKELLETVVNRSRELKSHRGSKVMIKISETTGTPPTSHFHVLANLEALLSTLELNFFLTKYFEMSDRDGRKVTVFSLNYGLCQKYNLEYGRPRGQREFRLYFVERVFDYSSILVDYMKDNQEVVCENCNEKFDIEMVPALQLYGMQCPKCKNGLCIVINLSKKYESVIQNLKPELLLPKTELEILQTLATEKEPLYARQIAAELDCSYQLVGKRGKILKQNNLVNRELDEQGRPQFSITSLAEGRYFKENNKDVLNVDN